MNYQQNDGNNSDFQMDLMSVDCSTNSAVNIENIIESTSSSIDNKQEQFTGNIDSQIFFNNSDGAERNVSEDFDYAKAFDEEILFVCAEEELNSAINPCEQIHDNGSTTTEERLITINNFTIPEEPTVETKETSKNEEPTKGRIYVVSNLMKTTSDSIENNKQLSEVLPETNNEMVEVIESNDEEDILGLNNADNTRVVQIFLVDDTKKPAKRKKAIGRPKGGRNNRYSCKFMLLLLNVVAVFRHLVSVERLKNLAMILQ